MTQVQPMTPITLAPQSDVPPHAYVLLKHLQVCLHCNTQHEWVEVYSETHLKSRLHMGKYVTNLRPVREPKEITYNLPIRVTVRPVERVAFCHECFDRVTLAHLPPPPSPKPEVVNRFANSDPYPNDAQQAKKPAKSKPTLDDLSF